MWISHYIFERDFSEYTLLINHTAARNVREYKHGVTKMYQSKLTKTQQAQIDVLDTLGKKYGLSFVVADTLNDDGGNLNGLQIAGTNRIAIALDAEGSLYLRTAGHECMHFIEDQSPKQAAQLTKYVIDFLKSSKDYDYNARVNKYASMYNFNVKRDIEKIHSEMAADSMFDVFTNEKFVKKIVSENKTLAEKIRDFLEGLIKQLKGMVRAMASTNPEMKALTEHTEACEQIRDKFTSALDEASKAFAVGEKSTTKKGNAVKEDGVKYSIREDAKDEIRKVLSNKKYGRDIVLSDYSPSIITSQKGAKNLPMIMKASHIRENIFTEAEASNNGLKVDGNINYHGLGETLFINVIDGLDNVTLAYRGTSKAENPKRRENYFLLISQFKDLDGNTINVPIFINEVGQYNRTFIDVNKIATVFGRNNFYDYIKREVSNGNLVRIKNRSKNVSERTAPIAVGYNISASDINVPQTDTSVNTDSMQKSEKDTIRKSVNEKEFDSEGNKLTKEQMEFLKDSKVRDENGNLLVVYHGTNEAGFTVFDPQKSDDNTSLFFSDNATIASSYSKSSERLNPDDLGDSGLYSVYLNIKNPYICDGKYKYWNSIDFNESRGTTREIAAWAKEKG